MKKLITTMPALLALALSNKGTGGRYAAATGMQLANSSYTGQGDPDLVIPGNVQSFAQEGYIGHRFGFSIKNSSDGPLTARLFAGYNTGDLTAAPGQLKDGAFNDVDGRPGLVATSTNSRKKINGFLNYVLYNPTRIVAMRITCATRAQFNQEINVGSLDPFVDTTSYPINPGLAFNSGTFDDKVADVNTDGLQVDDKSDITYTIEAGTTVNFLLFAGASLSPSQALAVKAAVAKNNLMLG